MNLHNSEYNPKLLDTQRNKKMEHIFSWKMINWFQPQVERDVGINKQGFEHNFVDAVSEVKKRHVFNAWKSQ